MQKNPKTGAEAMGKGGVKIRAMAVCGIVLAVAIAAAAGFALAQRGQDQNPGQEESIASQPQQGVISGGSIKSLDDAEADAQEPPSAGSYIVTMGENGTNWHFEDGVSESYDAYVENSTGNRVDTWFEITLESDGSQLYRSGTITTGTFLEGVKLDRELAKGTYDCIMTYHLLDQEDGQELGTLKLALEITIEN